MQLNFPFQRKTRMIRFVGYRFVGLLLLSSSFSKTFLGLGQAGKLRVRMAETAEKQAIRMNMPRNPITGERPCNKWFSRI